MTIKGENLDVKLDFDIYRWKLAERIAFEKVAGMTCERAVSLFAQAGSDADAALDIPAAVQTAFAWIAARRKKPGLTFDEVAETWDGQDFLDAIPDAVEEEAPLVEQRPTSKKSSARSATTSTTPPSKSGN